mmetsp:Transcript_14413/g.23956  ORF Transcript_14413/g.23956 Transcript_14413/m.23956 type:complete len:147 (+) Transcript_14413:82-522(+)
MHQRVVLRSLSTKTGSKRSPWNILVGLELHAQIKSRSKLFSGASTDFGERPNTQVALFDAAIPGTLPRLNAACVEQAIRTGLAVGGSIQTRSKFERKHYLYYDLPLGYQITQRTDPIVLGGHVVVPHVGTGVLKKPARPSQYCSSC